MSAKAVVVMDSNGAVVNAEATFKTAGTDYRFNLTNQDGYSLLPVGLSNISGYLVIVANGYKNYLQPITLDSSNQEIHCSNNEWGPPNTIHLPPLSF